MREQDNAAFVRRVHDQGLRFDRRRLLAMLGGAGALAALGACSSSDSPGSPASADGSAPAGGSTSAGGIKEVASETAGPYPADGSNGPDVRTLDGIVRKDIRPSFGSSTTVAGGVPLEFALVVHDRAGKPVSGAAVYAWHCDQGGNYSLYSQAAANENYLRGVQATDGSGVVTFKSIFPACYLGRWPHIHFEVYPDLEAATDEANKIATSQVALPKDACDLVYATAGYEGSVRTMSQVSLENDNVFGEDDGVHQLGTISGDVAGGMTVALTVPVRA
jgi:protocatechuate 3,4-dioxygenase beta subunit